MKSTLVGVFLFVMFVSWAFAQQAGAQTDNSASGGGAAASRSGPRAVRIHLLRTQSEHTNHRSPEEPTKPGQKRGM